MDLTNPQIIMRDKEIAQLRAENEKLAAALAAKDAALQRCTKFTQEDYDALDLKPHAALVAKLKAEAVREFGRFMSYEREANDYGLRIEGEAKQLADRIEREGV